MTITFIYIDLDLDLLIFFELDLWFDPEIKLYVGLEFDLHIANYLAIAQEYGWP